MDSTDREKAEELAVLRQSIEKENEMLRHLISSFDMLEKRLIHFQHKGERELSFVLEVPIFFIFRFIDFYSLNSSVYL